MIYRVKVLTVKTNNLSSTLQSLDSTWWEEGTDSQKWSFDLYMCATACISAVLAHTHTHMRAHTYK